MSIHLYIPKPIKIISIEALYSEDSEDDCDYDCKIEEKPKNINECGIKEKPKNKSKCINKYIPKNKTIIDNFINI